MNRVTPRNLTNQINQEDSFLQQEDLPFIIQPQLRKEGKIFFQRQAIELESSNTLYYSEVLVRSGPITSPHFNSRLPGVLPFKQQGINPPNMKDQEQINQIIEQAQPSDQLLSPMAPEIIHYFLPPLQAPLQCSSHTFNIKQIEDEKKADLTKLQELLNSTKPKINSSEIENSKEFTFREARSTSTGYHKFFSTSADHSDVDQFGIGIALYFRFMKMTGCFYFIFFLLSLPQIIFSIESAQQSEVFNVYSIQQWLYASTVSSMGLGNQFCQVNQFDQGYMDLQFSCQTGTIDFKTFTIAIVDQTYQSQQDCNLIIIPNQLFGYLNVNDSLMQNYSQICDGTDYCTFNISQSDYPTNFSGYNLSESTIYTQIYCKDSYVSISDNQILRSQIPSIMAGFDIIIIVLYIFMLINLRACERDYTARAIFWSPQIQQFTLQFSNLPQKNLSDQQLKAKIWRHIEKQSKQYMIKNNIPGDEMFMVYDVKISESQELFTLKKKLRQEEILLAHTIRRYLNDNELVITEETISFDMLSSLTPLEGQVKNKKVEEQLNVVKKLFDKVFDYKEKLGSIKDLPQENIKYLWATFLTQDQAFIASEAFKTTRYERMILFFSPDKIDQDLLIVNGEEKKLLTRKPAPNPGNIIWENLHCTRSNRNIRQTLTWSVTLIVLFLSFLMIVSIRNFKNVVQQSYPVEDCSQHQYDNISNSKVVAADNDIKQHLINEIQLPENDYSQGYIDCYCSARINRIIKNTLSADVSDICNQWFGGYTQLEAIKVLSVVGLILINIVIPLIFLGMSEFEKMEIVSDEYKSRVLKIFLGQFLNTALILLITNADFNPSSDHNGSQIFGGQYSDMSQGWYTDVGLVVLLTILTNIITIPIMLLIDLGIQKAKIFYDRGFSLDKLKTRKKTMDELVELYAGPEFLVDVRYGEILNLTFVCMMYGAGMPALYLFTAFTLFICYWTDKFWIFLFYRKPQNFDASIIQRTREILFFACIIHCGFAIFIYGDQNNFYDPTFSVQHQNLSKGDGLQQSQFNWALTTILGLTTIFVIIALFFLKPFQKLLIRWNIFIIKQVTNPNYDLPLTNFLNTEQLENEVKVTQFHIQKSEDQDYKDLLIGKQQYIIDFLNTLERPHCKGLAGIQSYDIAFNKKYSECFDWNSVKDICIKESEVKLIIL